MHIPLVGSLGCIRLGRCEVKRSHFRGHPIIQVDGVWVYEDTLTKSGFDGVVRPCKRCNETFQGSNHGKSDPCLGDLPGVDNACCGHGATEDAYIRFTNGVVVKGFTTIEYTVKHKKEVRDDVKNKITIQQLNQFLMG